jgi:hypothetical protein
MKNLIIKTTIIAAFLFQTSCAFIFNKKDIELSFKSYPEGAKVFVDGEIVGKTPVNVRLVPDKNHDILYLKDGYANRDFRIRPVIGDSRLRPSGEYTACILDAVGSILIIPLISVLSTYCAQFEQQSYFKSLDKGNRSNVLIQDN